jgi:hypothetical protein
VPPKGWNPTMQVKLDHHLHIIQGGLSFDAYGSELLSGPWAQVYPDGEGMRLRADGSGIPLDPCYGPGSQFRLEGVSVKPAH